jgi:AraC-like DNA-binding protein
MKFERVLPTGSLKDYVQYFWTLESPCAYGSPVALGPLADGCPGLIFQPAGEGSFYEGTHKRLPELFLYGQTLTRIRISLLGRFRAIGALFFPHTLRSFFGFDASGLTDICLDVGLLSAHLPERLLNASSAGEQIDILASWLSGLVRKTDLPVDAVTGFALRRIMTTGGQFSLPQLQQDLKLSERSLERRFNQHVGIPPRLFARVCQFQAALHQLKSNRYTRLSDVAFDNGYADQSHFIRTFRAFAGVAPHQWQKQAHPVSDHFPVLSR